jgi:hypothetical protein
MWGTVSDERTRLSFTICCWPSSAQSLSGPSPVGVATILYCLRFETSFCRLLRLAGLRWRYSTPPSHEIIYLTFRRNLIYCDAIWPFARQRFGKHRLKGWITTEAEVHLLGSGSLDSAATDNRITEEQFEMVTYIRAAWKLWKGVEIPCGGGVEYLHLNPACRRRRPKGKSRIWDSKLLWRIGGYTSLIRRVLIREIGFICSWVTHSHLITLTYSSTALLLIYTIYRPPLHTN